MSNLKNITLETEMLPEGHGLSFKKGISDVLMNENIETGVPNGHEHSYRRGREIGIQMQEWIASTVKKPKKEHLS